MSQIKILYTVLFLMSSSLGLLGTYSFYGASYASEKTSPSTIIQPLRQIYIGGGVRKPGIYKIPKGALIYQAVQLAGGLTAQAKVDSQYLMQILPKSGHILISAPVKKLPVQTRSPLKLKKTKKKKLKPSPFKGKISIQNATLLEWQKLPGIGPKLADRIVRYRKKKPFKRVQDLINVKGIGEKRLKKWGPYLK